MSDRDQQTGDWDVVATMPAPQKHLIADVVSMLADACAQCNTAREAALRRRLSRLSRDLYGDPVLLLETFDRAWVHAQQWQHSA